MVISRPIIAILVVTALVLPLAQAVLFLVGLLLRAMNDLPGYGIVEWIILITLVVWVFDLVLLVVALGIRALGPPDSTSDR